MRGNNLVPLDLEIETTYRRNNVARRRREQQEVHSNQGERGPPLSELSSPSPVTCPHPFSEEHIIAEDLPLRMTLKDYSSFVTPQYFTSIARPDVQAANISYPHFLIQLIQGNLFHGLSSEDPYAQLASYIEICNMVKIGGVPKDAIRLNLFSFSFAGEAKRWLRGKWKSHPSTNTLTNRWVKPLTASIGYSRRLLHMGFVSKFSSTSSLIAYDPIPSNSSMPQPMGRSRWKLQKKPWSW